MDKLHRSLRPLGLLFVIVSFFASAHGSVPLSADAAENAKTVRVFIFAGQSNMVGADSKVRDIDRFPPYRGLDKPQPKVQFNFCIGRENKTLSDGWEDLAPVKAMVGPELSFARRVSQHVKEPIAIVKIAAGGTTLGEDWNPSEPGGFELYPLALEHVRSALAALEKKGVTVQLDGFVWHQGENDMFNKGFRESYGKNLGDFVASWRRDLEAPDLRFYIGGHCTKTVWGMDNRANMHAIEQGQLAVTDADDQCIFVPTSHVGVEIGGETGLHYHYGTLGQLQHGEAYADAYLTEEGHSASVERPLKKWPYRKGSKVTLFVLAGHRNMEGERAFANDLSKLQGGKGLLKDDHSIAFRYSMGGGARVSGDWEPMGPAGFSETFGPELSFAARVEGRFKGNVAIAKYTHSGSQIADWTPEGTATASRNLYAGFVEYVREAVRDLEERGHRVELGAVLYHVGENDTAWRPYRAGAAERIKALVTQLRTDLGEPELRIVVSQQEPADHDGVNTVDVVSAVRNAVEGLPGVEYLEAFELPGREQELVMTAAGVVALGDLLAKQVLGKKR